MASTISINTVPDTAAGLTNFFNGNNIANRTLFATTLRNIIRDSRFGGQLNTAGNGTIPPAAIQPLPATKIQTQSLSGSAVTGGGQLAWYTLGELNFANNAIPLRAIPDLLITNAKIANSTINIAKINAAGTRNNTTFLRGDSTWSVVTPPLNNVAGSGIIINNNTSTNQSTISHGTHGGDVSQVAGNMDLTIVNGAITAAKLANNAVITDRINASAVTNAKISNGAVTAEKIANGSIISDKIADNGVTTSKLQNGAVTYPKIRTVATANRVLGSTTAGGQVSEVLVNTDMIVNGAVTTAKIGDGQVTGAKLAANIRIESLGVGTAASGTVGEIRATNNITAFFSDERLKNFEGKIPDALQKVEKISGYYFTINDTAKALGYTDTSRQVGVNAQEIQNIMPEAVKPAPIDDKYLTVQYEKLVPLLIESIKELNKKVNELESKLNK